MNTFLPLNVDYWSLRYSAQQDDDAEYVNALESHTNPLDRAQALWDWKDLSRGVSIDSIVDSLSNDELTELTSLSPAEAVATLSDHLVERDVLANKTVVTPAFLLHLADSGSDVYSNRFPIFDVRCWVAYVYLTQVREPEQALSRGATSSPDRFGEFSNFFQQTIPGSTDARQYEQALFRFGAYISSLPVDTIAGIDKHLNMLEVAVMDSQNTKGFALVRITD